MGGYRSIAGRAFPFVGEMPVDVSDLLEESGYFDEVTIGKDIVCIEFPKSEDYTFLLELQDILGVIIKYQQTKVYKGNYCTSTDNPLIFADWKNFYHYVALLE